MQNSSDQNGEAGFTKSKKDYLLQFILINIMRYVSYLLTFSDNESLRSSIILLLIKYPDKLFFKKKSFVLVVESIGYGDHSQHARSQKCFSEKLFKGMNKSSPDLFNTSFDTGKASELLDSFL